MNEIVILNLADTHITNVDSVTSDYFTRAKSSLINYLNAYLESGEGKRWKPDFICICGDIVHSGSEKEYEIAKKFILDVCKACSLTPDRVNMVPGNHDMTISPVRETAPRKADTAVHEKKRKDYLNFINDYSAELEEFFENGTIIEKDMLINTFSHYSSFRGSFISDNLSYIPYKYFANTKLEWVTGFRKFPKFKVVFWELNNTWRSLSHDPDQTKRYYMKFGQHIITDMQKKLEELKNDNYLVVSLFHHSFFKLAHEEYRPAGANYCMYDAIIELSDICLSGHEHGANTRNPDFLKNSAQYFLNGSFFDINKKGIPDSSFSILKINRNNNSIEKKQFCYHPNDNTWERKETSIFQLHFNNYEHGTDTAENLDFRFKTLTSRDKTDKAKQNAIIERYWGAKTAISPYKENIIKLSERTNDHYVCFINMDNWDRKAEDKLAGDIELLKKNNQYPVLISCYASWEALESPTTLKNYQALLEKYKIDILQCKTIFFLAKFEKN